MLTMHRLVPLHAAAELSGNDLFWKSGKGEAEKKIRFVFFYTTTRKCSPRRRSASIAHKCQSILSLRKSFRSSPDLDFPPSRYLYASHHFRSHAVASD